MKKRKTNQLRLRTIGVLAILLLAAQSTQAVDYKGGEYDVTDDVDFMNIWDATTTTTVNLYANVSQYIYVHPGTILNIYSGNVTSFIALLINGSQHQIVTVYGTNFKVDGVPVPAGTDQFTPVPNYPGSVLTGTYENGDQINLRFVSDIPIHLQPVESQDEIKIDVKPDSNPNTINLKSRGVVPVALLTAGDFKAGDIDPGSVEFEGASPVRTTLCDVDGDGKMDMLFHFKTQDLVDLNEDSTDATLTATIDGVQIEATDSVRIVPQKKK